MPLQTNTLYYGDNLQILRDYIPDESIDLIYLDPPFNSQRSYNVLFKESTTAASAAQMEAFEDTWHWNDPAIAAYEHVALYGTDDTAKLLKAMVDALGNNDVTAYLSMMAIRLIEMRRALKPTGSIYLHCDPTASHYLKVLMDSIFGPTNFVNEVVWKRTSSHNDTKRFGRIHDCILVYGRGSSRRFNVLRRELDPSYVEKFYTRVDENGRRYRLDNISAPGGRGPIYEWHGRTQPWRYTREHMEQLFAAGRIKVYPDGRAMVNAYVRYLDENEGQPIQDWWDDIGVIAAPAKERLGYPTQKPLPLLDRIIEASSNPGDIVLDPFCGCGTAVHAAQALGRKWIGIDVTHLAIGLIRTRMQDAFPSLEGSIAVVGEPVDLTGAAELAATHPYQFQWWALGRLSADTPQGDRKKGMDRGIDGIIAFLEGESKRRRVIVSVKAGKLTPNHVRDLKGVLEREGEPIGVLFSLNEPTREMKTEAAAAGMYRSETWNESYPKIQLITAADIFNGRKVAMPPRVRSSAAPPVERKREGKQTGLDL